MEPYATTAEVWVAALVFARTASLIMLIPGVGDGYVPVRVRLCAGLLITFCMMPIAAPSLPPVPDTLGAMAGDVIRETLVGLMIGGILRLIVGSLTTCGELVSLQTSLSFAQTANPAQAQPTTSVSTFLMLVGVTLIFDTGLHQMFIAAIARSYTLFPATKALPVHDAGLLAIQTVGSSFALGVQLAAPVIVFSLVFNVAVGLIGRAMPQFQVFFVATPLGLLLGLSLFALSLGGIGLAWVRAFGALLQSFA